MKNQAVILLVVAVGCGLVAMLGVKQAISQKTVEHEESIQVLQASDDIAPGTPLDDLNTHFVGVPASAVPEGAVRTLEEYAERALTIPAVPGDWILKSKLGEKGQFGAVNNIPPGMVVVTIPVDATQSHSGMLRPGNRIDLLLTHADASAGTSIQKTITVLEFVEVFAVDNRVAGIDKDGDAEAKNITLLVTPEQGKAVTLARRIEGGTLSTLMRGKPVADANTQAEISQDFLTSSFMRSNKNVPSVMDRREDHGKSLHDEMNPPDPAMSSARVITDSETAEDLPSLDELLDQEISGQKDPGGSGPVPKVEPKKNTWTMRIYEGENLRVESVEIADAGGTNSGESSDWSVWNLFRTK